MLKTLQKFLWAVNCEQPGDLPFVIVAQTVASAGHAVHFAYDDLVATISWKQLPRLHQSAELIFCEKISHQTGRKANSKWCSMLELAINIFSSSQCDRTFCTLRKKSNWTLPIIHIHIRRATWFEVNVLQFLSKHFLDQFSLVAIERWGVEMIEQSQWRQQNSL